jgi:hypothetical protein
VHSISTLAVIEDFLKWSLDSETVSSIADPVAQATDEVLAPLVRRFQGTIIDSTSSPAFAGLPKQVIPAIAPHLGIASLNAGRIGLCGRDARKDGLCRLLPPLSCYLCPSFAPLHDGPHREVLISIEAFLNGNQEASDKRIAMQLADVRAAVRQCWSNCPERNNAGAGEAGRTNGDASGIGHRPGEVCRRSAHGFSLTYIIVSE